MDSAKTGAGDLSQGSAAPIRMDSPAFAQNAKGRATRLYLRDGILKTMSSGKRARGLMLEILIGLVLVTAFVAYLFSLPKGTKLNWQRIALVLNTFVVFGFLISWFRHQWKRLDFWATMTVLLLIHTAVYLFVLSRTEGWRLAGYVMADPAELALFAPVLRKVIGRDKGGR
jgi:hypothetical protein